MLSVNSLVGFGSNTAAPAVGLTFIETPTPQTTNAATFTFSSADIGTADADRIVVVGATGSGFATGKTITGITLGGDGMTEIIETNYSYSNAGIYAKAVASGTSSDIAVTFSNTNGNCVIYIYSMIGASITPTDTDVDSTGEPSSLSLNVAAGGVGIGCWCTSAGSGLTTVWTGLTEDHDTGGVEDNAQSSASISDGVAYSPLSITGTSTPGATGAASVCASFPLA
jgi:hypothetical protein